MTVAMVRVTTALIDSEPLSTGPDRRNRRGLGDERHGRVVTAVCRSCAVFPAGVAAAVGVGDFRLYAGDKVPVAASEVDGCVDGLRITIAIPIQTSVRMVLTNANCETDNCRIAVPR